MRSVQVSTFGDPDGMAIVEIPEPVPSAGRVVVAVEAAGVGGVDAVIRRGTLADAGFREGHVLGSEVAGTVSAVGDGVDGALLGRRVWAFTGTGGGYVEQALASVDDVVGLPDGLSATDAVTLGSGVVAHFGLQYARFAAGETVLVRGAAGSIGIMAVQLAARGDAGAVAVTTSSPQRGDRLRALGATHVLDRSGTGDTGAPVEFDVVLDVVGGAGLPSFVDRLAPNGRMVGVGVVDGMPPADFGTRLLAGFRKSISFGTFSADTVRPADRNAVRRDHFAAAARGELRAVVHDVLPLADAARAHRAMDDGTVFGRIVLTP